MRKNLFILSASLLFLSCSQVNGQPEPIKAFENLIGGKWISQGKQLGGFNGKTEIQFEWGLNGKIVKATTYATDPKTMEFGLRNEGIRAYSAADKVVQFYEFDKLGGITKGEVLVDGTDLHYNYEYQGMMLRDSWIFVDNDQYTLIVGVWQEDKWSQKFHEQVFRRNK
ncbi:MAG: hypothetical protein ACR2MX_06450 [Cyclobacteriaceae bacterium]